MTDCTRSNKEERRKSKTLFLHKNDVQSMMSVCMSKLDYTHMTLVDLGVMSQK